jgi:glycerol-1-phosphate dehydrogenase [NAD(P)+]
MTVPGPADASTGVDAQGGNWNRASGPRGRVEALAAVAATRTAEVPSALRFTHSDSDTSRAVCDVIDGLGVRRPLFVFGREGAMLIGRSIVIDCHARLSSAVISVGCASLAEVARVAAAIAAGRHDAVIGCGGGQTLDVAKYAAFQAAVPFVSLPTQATHDGIASPVAVLRDGETRRGSSHGAVPPAAVVVPVHLIARSSRRTIVSGMADLAANLIAVEDWLWTRDVDGESFDDYAALLSRSAAYLVVSRRDAYAPDREFSREDVERLVHGLVLSGLAMTLAGSSRPCSGPEHLISHAFDSLGLGHGTHGEQVAVGSTLAAHLYDADLSAVLTLLENVGAPTAPADIGIDADAAMRAIDIVHEVRPERSSRLSTARVADREFVLELARRAWRFEDATQPDRVAA